ncbi:MAG: lysophospholipid acyltransferase family protein, partial [Maribacter sp.]
ILCLGMLHPKMIFLVNDWVYNSPVFGSAAKLVGAYPVSGGIENGEDYLREKVAQGFSLIAFPEGTRSTTNKIKRFHKGAFYLAEQFDMDILPVLIHGNSEVLPKGSFVIRDGSITLKILPRIKPEDTSLGEDYTKQGKGVGAYFRSEFRRLRDEIEVETYWHKTILEHYRFKGENLYKVVRKDLKTKASSYRSVLNIIGQKDTIIHISEDYGQLDLLLALDAIDRKIYSYLKEPNARVILQNSFLTHQYSKITVLDTQTSALSQPGNTLILTTKEIDVQEIAKNLKSKITTLILLKSGLEVDLQQVLSYNFSIHIQNDNFIVLIKRKS